MSSESGRIRVVLDYDSRIALRRRINTAVRAKAGLCLRCGMRECLPECGKSVDTQPSREQVARERGYRTRRWTDHELRAGVNDVARLLGRRTIHRDLYDRSRDPAKHPTSNTVIARLGDGVFEKKEARCRA